MYFTITVEAMTHKVNAHLDGASDGPSSIRPDVSSDSFVHLPKSTAAKELGQVQLIPTHMGQAGYLLVCRNDAEHPWTQCTSGGVSEFWVRSLHSGWAIIWGCSILGIKPLSGVCSFLAGHHLCVFLSGSVSNTDNCFKDTNTTFDEHLLRTLSERG